MKKLLFAVCALVAISMLAPSAGFAQWENRIGIYTDANATDDHIASQATGVPFNIYFVLTSPKNADGSDIAQLDAFEFRVTVNGTAGTLFKLGQTLPTGSINVGADTDPFNAEYAVGIATPVPVTGGLCSLLTWNCMTLTGGTYQFFLNPTSVPSVAGKMAINTYVEGNATLVGCMPSSDDFANPVFAVNGDVVAIENDSFGGVKALFR